MNKSTQHDNATGFHLTQEDAASIECGKMKAAAIAAAIAAINATMKQHGISAEMIFEMDEQALRNSLHDAIDDYAYGVISKHGA